MVRAMRAAPSSRAGRKYSRYALAVLVLVYVVNFIDRQILSILAEDIKADLGLSDASLGFLYGTAFAVFYAIFGIPLGRLADRWNRKNLIALGLFVWSLLTALSGTARGLASLASYRIGVGIGESSASPAAFSLLGDYFPPRRRATAVAIYSSGVFLGSGIGMFLGGWIVDAWNGRFPAGGPLGLVGWQAAFIAVGAPGLVLALWVWTLREPERGVFDGGAATAQPAGATEARPLRLLLSEVAAVLPPLTVVSLTRAGAGRRRLAANLGLAAACALGACALTAWTGDATQWIALGVGCYAFGSWLQGLALRDRPAYELIFRSPTMVFAMLGFGFMSFVGYGISFWFAPLFLRSYEVTTAQVGLVLGLVTAISGWLSVTLGGFASDWLKEQTPRARPYVGMATAVAATGAAVAFLRASSIDTAYALVFVFQFATPFWIGSAVALANEIVLPRMRATASAFYLLSVTFIGLALGPYTIGKLSDAFTAGGLSDGAALRRALAWAVAAYGVAFVCFLLASRTVERDETGRIERARAAGEPI